MALSVSRITALPLPRSKRIEQIIHLSDVHIPFLRTSAEDRDRQQRSSWKLRQHLAVIRNLVDGIESLSTVVNGEAVVLIAGDVLDCKNVANATTVALLHQLIEGLTRKGTPVYVTAGNHDLALDDTSTPHSSAKLDLLGELLAPLCERLPVAYMNETGVYGTKGTGVLFGLLHVRDAMAPGNCSGDTRPLDEIPFGELDLGENRETADIDTDDSRVFVYHGQVTGYRTLSASQHEHVDRGRAPGFPSIASSLGYDVCMFGDIHTMQVHGVTEKKTDAHQDNGDDGERRPCVHVARFGWRQSVVPWAYSGSPLQLNAGERLFPHGFLAWRLRERLVDAYHVVNPLGIMFLSFDPSSALLLLHNAVSPICDSGVPHAVDLGASASDPSWARWLPEEAVVRVVGGGAVTTRRMDDVRSALHSRCGIRTVGHNTSSVTPLVRPETGSFTTDDEIGNHHHHEPAESIDLSQFGRVECWLDYLRRHHGTGRPDHDAVFSRWERWLRTPEGLSLSLATEIDENTAISSPLPEALVTKLNERNAKIAKKVAEVRERGGDRSESAASAKVRFSLRHLRWSWMLCYGKENTFDFSKIDGRVALLSAPNGRGKSSVLEVLCVALYGQPMVSRGGKTSLGDALCRMRPVTESPASCSVDIEIAEEGTFRVSRSFSSSSNGRTTSSARVSKVVPPNESLVTVKDGSSAVNTWVAAHLGTLGGFLLCSLLTQSSDADFFGMRGQDQKALLDDALALDGARAMTDALKEARLAHGFMSDAIQNAIEGARARRPRKKEKEELDQEQEREKEYDDATDIKSEVERMEIRLRDIEDRVATYSAEMEQADGRMCDAKARLARMKAAIIETSSSLSSSSPQSPPQSEENENEDEGDYSMDDTLDELEAATIRAERATSTARRFSDWSSEWPLEYVRAFCKEDGDVALEKLVLSAKTKCEVVESSVVATEEARSKAEADADSARVEVLKASAVGASTEPSIVRQRALHSEEGDVLGVKTVQDAETVLRDLKNEEVVALTDEQVCEREVVAEKVMRLFERASATRDEARKRREELDEAEKTLEDRERTHLSLSKKLSESENNGGCGTDAVERGRWFSERRDAVREVVEHRDWRCSLLTRALEDLDRLDRLDSQKAEDHDDGDEEEGYDERSEEAYEEVYATVRRMEGALKMKADIDAEVESTRKEDPHNDDCWACRERRRLSGKDIDDEKKMKKKKNKKEQYVEGATDATDATDEDNVTNTKRRDTDALPTGVISPTVTKAILADVSFWSQRWRDSSFSSGCGSRRLFGRWSLLKRLNASEHAVSQARDGVKVATTYYDAARVTAKESKALYLSMSNETKRVEQDDVLNHGANRRAASEVRDDICALERWISNDLVIQDEEDQSVQNERRRKTLDDATGRFRLLDGERDTRRSELAVARQRLSSIIAFKESAASEGRREALVEIVDALLDARRWQVRGERAVIAVEKIKRDLVARIREDGEAEKKVGRDLMRARVAVEEHTAWTAQHMAWCESRDLLEERKADVEALCTLMDGFTSWVYSHRALPAILKEVNALLRSMGLPLTLGGWCKQDEGGALGWHLNGTPMAKCSGMQRFAASLAMRVALSQLGASPATCAQLVIDEGFATLDADNIARVPEFLQDGIIGTGRYASVLLVSHLDGVREAADIIVPISYDGATSTSRLQFPAVVT